MFVKDVVILNPAVLATRLVQIPPLSQQRMIQIFGLLKKKKRYRKRVKVQKMRKKKNDD